MESLNTKLSLGFVVIFLIFAFFFIGLFTDNLNKNVLPITESISESLVDSQAEKLGILIENYVNEIELMSEEAVFKAEDLEAIQIELKRRSQSMNSDFFQLFYADASGINRTSLGYAVDISDRAHFQEILSGNRQRFISDPIVLRTTGEKAFVITVAVKSGDETVGLVGASISMESISRISSELSIGDSGQGWIIDSTGMIVAHQDQTKILAVNVFETQSLGLKNYEEAIKEGVSLNRKRIQSNGHKEVLFTRSIQGSPNWIFGFSISEADYYGSLNSFRRSFYSSTVILAVLLLFFLKIISSKIIKPIVTLDLLMTQAANGDLDVQHEYEGKDELGRMSRAFNEMIVVMKKSLRATEEANRQLIDTNEETHALYEQMIASEKILRDNYDELKDYKNQIEYLAYHNSDTDLFNKDYLIKRLSELLSNEHFSSYAVIFISIKELIHYMETLEQHVMDVLHSVLGRHLDQLLKDLPHEGLFDVGVGKYVLLIESPQKDKIDDFFRKVNRSLIKVRILEGTTIKTSLVFGGYVVDKTSEPPEAIIQYAEMAKSKTTSESCLTWFGEGMYLEKVYHAHLESDLQHAERLGEFYVVYQPIYNQDEVIIGAEALIRWNHRKYGLVPPDIFIPIAENTGNIDLVGVYVMEQVLKVKRKLLSAYNVSLPVSMNVSFFELIDPEFITRLNTRMKYYEVPRNELNLEITETAFSTHMDLAKDNLIHLMNSGYQVHLDDFGTGYSSLFYLNRFPVNALKIDKEFTNQFLEDQKSYEIIKLILDLASKLNMTTVAEGVETQAQFLALKEIGCTYYQGYYFSRPLEEERFIRLIAEKIEEKGAL